jgi:hypothetical protein
MELELLMAVGDIVHTTGAAATTILLQPASGVELVVTSIHGGNGGGGSAILVGLGNFFVNYAISSIDAELSNTLNCKIGITNGTYISLYQATTRVGLSAIQIK